MPGVTTQALSSTCSENIILGLAEADIVGSGFRKSITFIIAAEY